MVDIEQCNFYSREGYVRVKLRVRMEEILKVIDIFLDYLKNNKPDSIAKIVNTLIAKFEEITADQTFNIALENKYRILKEYPKLFELAKQAILVFLNYPKYQDRPINRVTKFLVSDYLRSLLFTHYYMATSLTSVMPRGNAINFYQDFHDYLTHKGASEGTKVENLADLMDLAKAMYSPIKTHNWTIFKMNDGKMGLKMTKCRYRDILEELNDPDFCYVAVCYPDFEFIKVLNKNFLLTRTQTLVIGNYCDFCYHDTRIEKDVAHPSKEFWEKELP